MDDNNQVEYVSSVDAFAEPKATPSVDVADEKALERLMRMVDGQIKLYHTISGMRLFDVDKFGSDAREAMCNEYVKLLMNFKQLANNAIDDIKESKK